MALQYILLYFITLQSTSLHSIIFHYTTLHYIKSHYTTLYHSVSHCITIYFIVLHYIILHHITLHYITSRCDRIHDSLYELQFYMTRLDLVDDSTQSFWNFFIKFDTWKEHLNLSSLEDKSVEIKTCKYTK